MKKVILCVTTFILTAGILGEASLASAATKEDNSTDGISVVSVGTTASDSIGARAVSWGEGILTSNDPLFGKPWGYGKTRVFAGTAYKLTAKIKSDNDGLGESASITKTLSNTTSVQSDTITSKTESTVFTSNHGIQNTSSSGWQYATVQKSY